MVVGKINLISVLALTSEGIRFTHAHVNTAVSQPCRQS